MGVSFGKTLHSHGLILMKPSTKHHSIYFSFWPGICLKPLSCFVYTVKKILNGNLSSRIHHAIDTLGFLYRWCTKLYLDENVLKQEKTDFSHCMYWTRDSCWGLKVTEVDTLHFPDSLIGHYLNQRPPCWSRDFCYGDISVFGFYF